MLRKIDVSKMSCEDLCLISDEEAKDLLGKGWTLSFVYSFQELRDVFIAFRNHPQSGSLLDFAQKYVFNIIPYAKSPWGDDERRVLEIKNALINFGLIDKDTRKCKEGVFKDVPPGTDLSSDDWKVFRDVFFHYFRFLEYASLFISPSMKSEEKVNLTEQRIMEESRALFFFSTEDNRVDSFLYQIDNPQLIYRFPKSDHDDKIKGGFVRFWDTFISWGIQLGIIERINLRKQGYILSNGKTLNACYFLSPNKKVNIESYVFSKYRRQLLIDVSQLILGICIDFRISVSDAQQALIDLYQSFPNKVSLIRTSEIFIKEKEISQKDGIMYPQYKGSFISHIKIRGNNGTV